MKKILTTALAMLLLLSTLASCAGDTTSTSASQTTAETETSTAEETTTSDEPELPEMDYEGADFTFLINSRTAYAYQEYYVFADEMDGDVINDAVYSRNAQTEDEFNIKIGIIENDAPHDVAKKSIAAGEDLCKAMSVQRVQLGTMGTGGYLADFNKVPYINMQSAYWDPNAAEQLEIAGKLFMMANDISMENLGGARFLFFNKKLVADYGLDDPYELVFANNWVLDTFLNMVKGVSKDMNGDGVLDRDDQFGMLSEEGSGNGNVLHLITGSGINYFDKDSDGRMKLSVMGERTESVITKVREVLYKTDYALEYNVVAKGADYSQFNHLYEYGRSLFAEDHFLFVQNGTGVTYQFKDMVSDYGVLPNPKYDSEQESYWHRTDPYSLLFAIPITNNDLEQTGLVLEYMAWLSSKTVLPAYYDDNQR